LITQSPNNQSPNKQSPNKQSPNASLVATGLNHTIMRFLYLFLTVFVSLFAFGKAEAQDPRIYFIGANVCGDEARTQFVLMQVGNTPYNFATNPPQLKVYCPTDPSGASTITAWQRNNTQVGRLNTKTGCSANPVFFNLMGSPLNGIAPAGSKILMFVGNNPDISSWPANTLSDLCGKGPFLVAFGNYTQGTTFFANSFTADPACGNYNILDVTMGAVKQSIRYDPALVPASNGAYVATDPGDIVRYGAWTNCGIAGLSCTAPAVTFTGDQSICAGERTALTVSTGSGHTYQWSNGATTASVNVGPEITKDYFVTITKTLTPACKFAAKAAVEVFSTPAVEAGARRDAANPVVCYGQAAELTHTFDLPLTDAPYTATWYDPTGAALPAATNGRIV
jgi:hypothetical protein